MNDLVTIKVFNFRNDLYLAKSFLESEGIECFVKDEFINQVYPLGNNEFGIKLQVHTEQAERAIGLLIEGGFAKKEDYEIPEASPSGSLINRLKKLFK